MAHNQACANASNPGCSCSGCGGSMHGWPGLLGQANDPPEVRADRRARAHDDWCAEVGTDDRIRYRRLSAPTERMLRLAATMARVDVTDHLAARPARARRIGQLGNLLHTEALRRLEAEAWGRDTARPPLGGVAAALPGHFWCALLAALAGAADRLDRAVEKIPQQARELIQESPPPDWGPARELVVDTALEVVWECALGLLGLRRPEELLVVMRVLAVFVCPDPGSHPEVVRLCLLPLGRGVLQDTTTMLLHQSLRHP